MYRQVSVVDEIYSQCLLERFSVLKPLRVTSSRLDTSISYYGDSSEDGDNDDDNQKFDDSETTTCRTAGDGGRGRLCVSLHDIISLSKN